MVRFAHPVTTLVDSGERLRRQNRVLVDLARRQSIHADLNAALRDVAVAAAETLDVDRVSIWFFTAGRAALRCAETYERAEMRHASGEELSVSRYSSYVHEVETERSIAAHDALTDPRTAALADDYLRPLGITSMLDCPIRHAGQISGLVCHVRGWRGELRRLDRRRDLHGHRRRRAAQGARALAAPP